MSEIIKYFVMENQLEFEELTRPKSCSIYKKMLIMSIYNSNAPK